MTLQEVLDVEFRLLMDDIIKEYDRLGMRASGETADSLEVITRTKGVSLMGNDTFNQLEYGRGATSSGASTSTKPLIERIKEWISHKGIVSKIKNYNDNSSLAWAITKKIHKQGWNRKGYGGVNLISNIVTVSRMQSIINKVGAELSLTLVTKLQNELKILTT